MKPELMADSPSQIWSWDITKLRGPSKGIFYHLYVLIDIFSRYNPVWLVSTCEESHLAADFIAGAIGRNGTAPHSVHADRGTSMTSKPVSMLLTNLGVTRTHSRPGGRALGSASGCSGRRSSTVTLASTPRPAASYPIAIPREPASCPTP